MKKASQVFILHFALKKRAFIEEIHEKQEQVWLISSQSDFSFLVILICGGLVTLYF